MNSLKSVSLDDARLESLLRCYSTFRDSDRSRILTAVVKNYRRSIGADNPVWAERWERALHKLTDGRLTLTQVVVLATDLSGESTPIMELRRDSPTLLADLGAVVSTLPLSAKPQLSLAVALHNLGLPPLLTYAFNDWQVEASSPLELGRRLGELAVMGLYRLAETHATTCAAGPVLASGAIADVVRSSGDRVTKLPRNYAARAVLLPEEYENFGRLARAGLGDRIPGGASFDAGTASLSRDYVEGPDGEAVLRSEQELSPSQRADLGKIYDRLQETMTNTGLVLDLHPGNFIWDKGIQRWILVDLGPIPVIGSAEYTGSSFDDYYRHTWLNRRWREQTEPIRSLDYNVERTPESGGGIEPVGGTATQAVGRA
ncbi:hypothetical protein ACQP1G_37700 [Nocardia sp. CA-107356]|uniref:hypothetical protein n=1 Tax=Nocardia sp. CA-107356 TaxID=3239972 RepID=UPI003D8DD41E